MSTIAVRIRRMQNFTLTLMAAIVVLCGAALGAPRWSASSRALSVRARDEVPADEVHWSVQTSGIDTNLRGTSVVNNPDSAGAQQIAVWACGSNGVILTSTDLGKTWKRRHVAGGDTLDFRSIVAFDAMTALVMSSG